MDEVAEAIEKYHGLVPLVYDIETMGLAEARPQDMYYAVYLKREADKVIAHNKVKRCLDKAGLCESEEKRLEAIAPLFDTDKECWEYGSDYWKKWHKRWLQLAEQVKAQAEAK